MNDGHKQATQKHDTLYKKREQNELTKKRTQKTKTNMQQL